MSWALGLVLAFASPLAVFVVVKLFAAAARVRARTAMEVERMRAQARAKAETRSYRSLSGRRRSASSVDGSGFWAERTGRPRRHPARKARREKARR